MVFYCRISSEGLASLGLSVEQYAEQVFEQCMRGEEDLGDHSGDTFVVVPYPTEPTEWCACLYSGTTRITKWFTYHTP